MIIKTLKEKNEAVKKIELAKKEINDLQKAIDSFKVSTFEVNKFYRWNFPSWYNGENPPHQGGRLQCVFVDSQQSVLRNQNGLHIVANAHLENGDIGITA